MAAPLGTSQLIAAADAFSYPVLISDSLMSRAFSIGGEYMLIVTFRGAICARLRILRTVPLTTGRSFGLLTRNFAFSLAFCLAEPPSQLRLTMS